MESLNKSKLKIAQVVCLLPPRAGGIAMVAHSYAEQLIKRGHDVTVFVPKHKGQNSEKKYKVKTLFTPIKIGLGAILPQLLWRLWSFDIVHFHYPLFGSSVFVAILKKLRGSKMKLVLTYHMDVNLTGWRKVYEVLCRTFFLDFILSSADKIIVSSEDYVENSRIQDFYFKNIDKFAEIPFGVPKLFKPEQKDHELLKLHGLSADDKIVLFVGGLGASHYFKGVNFLIKAFSHIEDEQIKCLIVGGGNLKADFEKLSKRLGLEKQVKFSGYVEPSLMVKYFNLGDVFILPSINSSEAFGIVLIEAMACGKPLIASNLKGVRSVVDVGINGILVEPKNSRDIANKINYLFQNPDKITSFGKSGLESVEKKYRWSVVTDKLEKIYYKLLK